MNNTSTEAGPCLKLQDAAGQRKAAPTCNGKSLQDTEVYS